MDSKWKLSILAIFLAMLSMITLATVTLYPANVLPANNTIVTQNLTFRFNVSGNFSDYLCNITLNGTGSTSGILNLTDKNVTNDSVTVIQFNLTDAQADSFTSSLNATVICSDPPVGVNITYKNQNWTTINLTIDRTEPVIVLNTTLNPANNSRLNADNYTIGFSVTDNKGVPFGIECDVYSNATTIALNTTFFTGNYTTVQLNYTANGTVKWRVACFDNATNYVTTNNYTVTLDTALPVILGFNASIPVNGTSTQPDMAMNIFWNGTSVSSVKSCFLNIINSTNSTIHNLTGTANTSTNTTSLGGREFSCNLTVNGSNIQTEGGIYLMAGVESNTNITNVSVGNISGFFVTKLTSGWNLVMVNENYTLRAFANLSKNITQISIFNVTTGTKDFNTSYTVGTATNENFSITTNNAVYVRTNTNVTLIRRQNVLSGTNSTIALGLGWNLAFSRLWNGSTPIGLCVASAGELTNVSGNATYVSWHKTADGIYYPHKCNFAPNQDLNIPLGSGYWIRVNGTSDYQRLA